MSINKVMFEDGVWIEHPCIPKHSVVSGQTLMVQPRRKAVAKRIGGIIEALKPIKAGKHGMSFAESVIDSDVERVLVADNWCVRKVIIDVAGALARLIGLRV